MKYEFQQDDDLPAIRQWLGKNLRKKTNQPKKYRYNILLNRTFSGKVKSTKYISVEIFNKQDFLLFKLSCVGLKKDRNV